MDYYHMMQGRMRHQALIDEAQRDAHFKRVGAIAPSILDRIVSNVVSLFARRSAARSTQPRRLVKN